MNTVLFQPLSGSYTVAASSLDNDGLTISGSDFPIDYYKGWFIKLTYDPGGGAVTDEFQVASNDATKLNFVNTISDSGTYSVEFITQTYLTEIESDMGSNKVSSDLSDNKISLAAEDIEQKIYAYFKHLYAAFDETDPLTLIMNLFQIQKSFAYKAIAQTYFDLIIEPGDTNDLKYERYKNMYKDLIKDAMSLLALDYNEDGELDNDEKATELGNGGLLSR
ncbi:MAG: hypothetical protein ACTSW1_08240 [Candidatus Hodarchaeales archaeon]